MTELLGDVGGLVACGAPKRRVRPAEPGLEDADLAAFYTTLDPHMAALVTEESIWVTKVPGEIFTPGASAPRSRRQDLRQLTDTIANWATASPEWLEAAPVAA